MDAFYASVQFITYLCTLCSLLKKKLLGSRYNCCERFERKDNYMKLRGIILALFLDGMVCNSNTKGAKV